MFILKLSIAVITMNRSEQLINALRSCLKCRLESDTEFVIIDNGSIDDTETRVNELFDTNQFYCYFEHLNDNLGVGGGRNYAISKCNGEYVYMLDDDAEISEDIDFFSKAIKILDNDEKIISLTTQIYDTAWGKNRLNCEEMSHYKDIFKCKYFCGGSHFLRRSFFVGNVYLANKYGFEEVLPSLKIYDCGKLNAFVESLLVIHKPKVDKWNFKNSDNYDFLINECAIPYAIKKMMFPFVFFPLLWLAYSFRKKKYISQIQGANEKCSIYVKDIIEKYPIDYKISFVTVIRLIKDFGISIF